MFFSDNDIKKSIKSGDIVINPIDENCLTPVGYDARVGNKAYIIYEDGKYKIVDIDADGELRIDGKATALIVTREYIEISKKVAGTIHSKVTLVSKGLSHISTTIDPGWKGKLLVQIHNHLIIPQIIEQNATFCTLVFYELKSKAVKPCEKPPYRNDISKHIEFLIKERQSERKSTEALPSLFGLLKKLNEIDDRLEEYKVEKVIMMSDEVESAKRQDTLTDNEAAAYTLRQREIIKKAVAENNGIADQTGGDGMISVYNENECENAIQAAVKIQKNLEKRNMKYSSEVQKILVRIGIEKGNIFLENGKPQLGKSITQATRIMSKADGGQILISDSVYNEVYKMKNYRFKSLGKKRLKGLSNEVEIYEVLW